MTNFKVSLPINSHNSQTYIERLKLGAFFDMGTVMEN